MDIEFVAFDSFGIKSACVQVKTADSTITIDPGISGEEASFPLSYAERAILWTRYLNAIKRSCRNSDTIIITHYHYDHHIPNSALYQKKLLLIKDPARNINKSQAGRAAYLLSIIKDKVKDIKSADGKTFQIGKTKISFSRPLWHGAARTKLGKVLMVTIKEGSECFLYTSDIDGPYIKSYVNLIAKERPDTIVLDGFPSYLLGFIASFANLKVALKNTIRLLKMTDCENYIIDHHLLRDYRYREIYYEVYKKAAELDKNVLTAAEAVGKKPKVLEGFEKHGPTRWRSWKPFTFEMLNKIIKKARAKARKK